MKAINNLMWGAWVALLMNACSSESGNQPVSVSQPADEQATRVALLEDSLSVLEAGFQATLDAINRNLDEISRQQAGIVLGPNSNVDENISTKERIIRNISIINTLLDDNKKKIASLNNRIRKYHLENTRLIKLTAEAEKNISARDAELEELKNQLVSENYHVAELNQRIDSLEWNSVALAARVKTQEDDLHRAWVAGGTRKELRDMGIVSRKGGLLGIGKTPVLNVNFPEDRFAKIDTRHTTSIPLNVKKARLVTSHPEGSYQFVKHDGLVASLEITDPDAFWRANRHMVIEEVR